MKTVVKQKRQTLQEIINNAQSGGGGGSGGDSYTKEEADAKFQTISGMSGYVPQSTNYFTVNGIRVYVASSAPSGEIPAGSIGIGW